MSFLARLSTNMQELRFVYHPEAVSNAGARQFLATHYSQIKRLNPGLPVSVRPFMSIQTATLTARYDYGGEVARDVTGMTVDQIREELRHMVDVGGVALKSDLYPWQESAKCDVDVVDYDPNDDDEHHL